MRGIDITTQVLLVRRRCARVAIYIRIDIDIRCTAYEFIDFGIIWAVGVSNVVPPEWQLQ